jgi:hypothetical protein
MIRKRTEILVSLMNPDEFCDYFNVDGKDVFNELKCKLPLFRTINLSEFHNSKINYLPQEG